MSILKRAAAVYLIVVAAAAGVHWIVSPLYDNSSGEYPIWVIMNWFMAGAIIVAADTNIRNKVSIMGGERDVPLTGRRVQINLLFYATIVLVLWYFWNWFYGFFPYNEPEIVAPIHLEMWTLINPLFVLTVGVTGFSAWQQAGEA
ncbi:MAG: hypothetical protein OXH22_10805 [Chloroflexi bacterium]|nr:hypothetical protein [Chloroflexota bacterium]